MALIESTRLSLGTAMPDFTLSDPAGKSYSQSSLMGPNGLMIVFTCNHCPYALAIWPRLIELYPFAQDLGISMVAINPNINPAYPDDSPQKMLEKKSAWRIPFPYLVDHTQTVAKNYQAQCTPDLYLLDQNSALAYHGRLDDNWKFPESVTREDLKEAMILLAEGKPAPRIQYPSMGCSIKWLNT